MANSNTDMGGTPLFMTQRRRIIESYKDAKEPFSASTKPYKSTITFTYQVANYIAASSVAWLIARKGQSFDWFGYKINDDVPGNVGPAPGYRAANEADTNLSKGRTTNGAEDFVIEGMSASHRSTRASYNGGPAIFPPGIVDVDVADASAQRCISTPPRSTFHRRFKALSTLKMGSIENHGACLRRF
jgi:hypothetical protein